MYKNCPKGGPKGAIEKNVQIGKCRAFQAESFTHGLFFYIYKNKGDITLLKIYIKSCILDFFSKKGVRGLRIPKFLMTKRCSLKS